MKKELLLILSIVALCSACDDDKHDDSVMPQTTAFSVVGDWYTEDDALGMFAECTYTASGAIYADEYRAMYGYKRTQNVGTYHVDGNTLISNMESVTGLSVQTSYTIRNLTALSFTLLNSENTGTQYLRIVGIVNMQVGDTLNFDAKQYIQAYTSEVGTISSYDMKNGAIASFDGTDRLTAKLIGTTYLQVESSVGAAVIKISVTDDENLWNDVSLVLGKDFDKTESLFGKFYAYKNDTAMQYKYDGYYVDSITVFNHGNIADSIVIAFREDVSSEVIQNYLGGKLSHVGDTLSYSWYADNENYLFSSYSARYYAESNILVYTSFDPEWDDRIYDYGLTYEELKAKYGRARTYDGSLAMYTNIVDNDFIAKISYMFYIGKVTGYHINVSYKVTNAMIERYLDSNFIFWKNAYYKNFQYEGREMELIVSVDTHDSHYLKYSFYYNQY